MQSVAGSNDPVPFGLRSTVPSARQNVETGINKAYLSTGILNIDAFDFSSEQLEFLEVPRVRGSGERLGRCVGAGHAA